MEGRMEKHSSSAFPGRYDRNRGVITEAEQQALRGKAVCVIGCGGLGGGVIENLTRLGVGRLTIVDGDVFEESNLNRQVLSHEENLGRGKAEEGAAQMKRINSQVDVQSLQLRVDGDNCRGVIAGHDLVVDALDNVQSRLILEDACEAEGIPLVHGAIGGWNGQAAVVLPGSRLLHQIYGGADEQDGAVSPETVKQGNPSFTPAIVAGIQAAEAVKLLLGREGALENRLLMMDMLEHEYEIIDFGM